MEIGIIEGQKRFGYQYKDIRAFKAKYGRLPTEQECNDGLKTNAAELHLSSAREYWTEIDGFNGKYEISNWGRVRNADTKSIMALLKKHKNIYYCAIKLDGKPKQINVMKEVLKHFGGHEEVPFQSVQLIDTEKPPTIDNIKVDWKPKQERKRKNKETIKLKEPTQDDWLKMAITIKNYTKRYAAYFAKAQFGTDEVQNEMLCLIMEN